LRTPIRYGGLPPQDFDVVVLVSPLWGLQLARPMYIFVEVDNGSFAARLQAFGTVHGKAWHGGLASRGAAGHPVTPSGLTRRIARPSQLRDCGACQALGDQLTDVKVNWPSGGDDCLPPIFL